MTILYFSHFWSARIWGQFPSLSKKLHRDTYLNERNCHSKFYCIFSCQKNSQSRKLIKRSVLNENREKDRIWIQNLHHHHFHPDCTIFWAEHMYQKSQFYHITVNHRSLIYWLPTSTLFWLPFLNVLQKTTYSGQICGSFFLSFSRSQVVNFSK